MLGVAACTVTFLCGLVIVQRHAAPSQLPYRALSIVSKKAYVVNYFPNFRNKLPVRLAFERAHYSTLAVIFKMLEQL